jgi:hypothetical protein
MRQNTLRVRLLGLVDLQLDNQPLPPLDSARAESLLAYLLLHRDAPQPRQRLAFLLWPGSSEGQAQTNLRKVLHTLRRALPGADRLIEIGPRTLCWRPDAPVWLDVERFERAVSDGRPAEAVGLYGGDLLEGRYDDWLAAERERLADRARRAAEPDDRLPARTSARISAAASCSGRARRCGLGSRIETYASAAPSTRAGREIAPPDSPRGYPLPSSRSRCCTAISPSGASAADWCSIRSVR